jgi:hypothetical protein
MSSNKAVFKTQIFFHADFAEVGTLPAPFPMMTLSLFTILMIYLPILNLGGSRFSTIPSKDFFVLVVQVHRR